MFTYSFFKFDVEFYLEGLLLEDKIEKMPSGNISKTQVAAACGEIILITVLGYYALKFIVNALDPTNRQRAEAKKMVCIILILSQPSKWEQFPLGVIIE